MTIEQWRVAEIKLEATEMPANPMLDADIWAVFTHEEGDSIRIPAYWDGENLYGLRFAPTRLGKWSYRVEAAPACLGLDGAAGEVECVPYTGEEEIFRHGFLKKGPRGRYLAHADGTPFFWLGDTHWAFVTNEKWEGSNYVKTDSWFRYVVDKRKEQRFTVYQCNLHCGMGREKVMGRQNGFAYFEMTEKGWLPVLESFQDNMDIKMQYLADKGFVIALGFAWYSSIDQPGADQFYKMAAKYLIARYGAYPIIWTLAGEVAGYTADKRETYIDGWREIALEIEKLDGYGHLQTCHYTNERPLADYYQEESWHDFTLNQCGHADLVINQKVYRQHMDKYPVKPFVEGEALYDGLITIEDLGRRMVDAQMVRLAAYTAMQNGACGYTYGAQGCWNGEWDWPEKSALTFWGNLPWYEGIEREGAESMRIMHDFYDSVGWSRMNPMYQCCKIHNPETTEQFLLRATPEVMSDPETKIVTAYYKGIAGYALRMEGLAADTYCMRWFDPATGKYQDEGVLVKTVNGGVEVPAKPDEHDWMLVLTAV